MTKEIIQALILSLFLSACNNQVGMDSSSRTKLSVLGELTGQNETLSQVKFDQDFVRDKTVTSLSKGGTQAEIQFTDRRIDLLGKISPEEFPHLKGVLGSNDAITYDSTRRVITIVGKKLPVNIAEISEFFLNRDLALIQQNRLKAFEESNKLVDNERFKELTVVDKFIDGVYQVSSN